MNQEKGAYSRKANIESRVNFIEPSNKGRTNGPLQEGVIHQITPLGASSRGKQQKSTEGARLAACQQRTIDPRVTPARVEKLAPQVEITRTREKFNLQILAEVMLQSLK